MSILDLLHEAGFKFRREPRDIFTSLIPPPILVHARRPPAIVPDAMGEATMLPALTARRDAQRRQHGTRLRKVYLWDIKTIHAGGGIYHCPRARDDQTGAVAERAHEVNGGASGGDYGRHARELDDAHSAVGTTPIADRLRSFGQVRALVFGTYSEASPDVHALITLAAHALAHKHHQAMGARNEKEARSWWVASCRRRIGTAVARAYARYRLRRRFFIGVPRAVLDERARRGVAGAAGGGDGRDPDADFHAFRAHQVHVRANAD